MKKRLLAILKAKQERKASLAKRSKESEDIAEVRGINEELETLNEEIEELRSITDAMPDVEGDDGAAGEQRAAQPIGAVNVMATYGVAQEQQQAQRSADKYDTPEYRSAFMDYVVKGVTGEGLEFRADATTGVGDIGAVIPSTILNKIVEKLKDYGRIYSRVTKTSVKGGVEIPIANAKPKATWVNTGTMSDKQKKVGTGKISFSYHKLQCRVAVELVADVISMPIFEQSITDNIYEAMVVAIEEAIISGGGAGQPLGIIKDIAIPADQIIEVTVEEFGKFKTWTGLIGKVPRSYRNRAVIIMNDSDWNNHILGMVDTNGQPVARVTYGLDGTEQERLRGKEAIPVEDLLPSINDAEVGDVVGIICNLSDYMLNSNMQMTFKRYFNEDTDEWVSKSTLIADGKLADRNGVVLIKKKA